MRTESGNRVTFHRHPVKPIPLYRDTIPAEMGLLCLDCSTIWDLRATACPACGSKAALHIVKTLDREGVEVSQ